VLGWAAEGRGQVSGREELKEEGERWGSGESEAN
jgi:hypothetical protein